MAGEFCSLAVTEWVKKRKGNFMKKLIVGISIVLFFGCSLYADNNLFGISYEFNSGLNIVQDDKFQIDKRITYKDYGWIGQAVGAVSSDFKILIKLPFGFQPYFSISNNSFKDAISNPLFWETLYPAVIERYDFNKDDFTTKYSIIGHSFGLRYSPGFLNLPIRFHANFEKLYHVFKASTYLNGQYINLPLDAPSETANFWGYSKLKTKFNSGYSIGLGIEYPISNLSLLFSTSYINSKANVEAYTSASQFIYPEGAIPSDGLFFLADIPEESDIDLSHFEMKLGFQYNVPVSLEKYKRIRSSNHFTVSVGLRTGYSILNPEALDPYIQKEPGFVDHWLTEMRGGQGIDFSVEIGRLYGFFLILGYYSDSFNQSDRQPYYFWSIIFPNYYTDFITEFKEREKKHKYNGYSIGFIHEFKSSLKNVKPYFSYAVNYGKFRSSTQLVANTDRMPNDYFEEPDPIFYGKSLIETDYSLGSKFGIGFRYKIGPILISPEIKYIVSTPKISKRYAQVNYEYSDGSNILKYKRIDYEDQYIHLKYIVFNIGVAFVIF